MSERNWEEELVRSAVIQDELGLCVAKLEAENDALKILARDMVATLRCGVVAFSNVERLTARAKKLGVSVP